MGDTERREQEERMTNTTISVSRQGDGWAVDVLGGGELIRPTVTVSSERSALLWALQLCAVLGTMSISIDGTPSDLIAVARRYERAEMERCGGAA